MKTLEGPQRGSQGDVVASANHYGQHLHKKGHPKKRGTRARLDADEAMRLVAEVWNSLTDAQMDRWALTGPQVPSRKVLGKAGRLDARGFFFKVNVPRARLGQKLLLEPPVQPDFGTIPFVGFDITNDGEGMSLELTLSRAIGEEIFVRASPPLNRGRRRNWDHRVLGTLKASAKGINGLTRLYVDKFDVPPVGKRIFIEVCQQLNGWRGKPWKASAVVPPWQARPRRRTQR